MTIPAAPESSRSAGMTVPLIERFRDRLPVSRSTPVVSLGEGSTPLLRADRLAASAGIRELWLKWEASNPTGSYKDRGMTVAVSKALEQGAAAVLCASTGNTAGSAAAYAARAGLPALVLTPQGAVAGAKLAQTRMLGATVLEVDGSFDDALRAAQELADRGAHVLVNSLNPHRREGQKTAVFEVVEELGGAPDAFVLPYGGGGNTSSYAQALAELGLETPIVSVEAADRRATLATAIRIGDPVHAASVRDAGAQVLEADDAELVRAWRALAEEEGLFCEPSSAAGLVAVLRGDVEGDRVVVTITGHGLKDPAAADRLAPPPTLVAPDPDAIAGASAPRKRVEGRHGRPRACHVGQPRPRVRLCGRRPRPLERARDHGRRRGRRRGRGRRRAPCRRDEPRRACVRARRRPDREAVSLRQPDPAGARARLVGRGDRARPRRGLAGCRPRGAARGRPDARGSRGQPCRGARRRRDAHVGRTDRADRRRAPALACRDRAPRAHVDRGVAPLASLDRGARGCGGERGPSRAPGGRGGHGRRDALRSWPRRPPPRAVPAVAGARARCARIRRRARAGRRSPARAPP